MFVLRAVLEQVLRVTLEGWSYVSLPLFSAISAQQQMVPLPYPLGALFVLRGFSWSSLYGVYS